MIKRFIVLAFIVCFSVNAYAQDRFDCNDDTFYQIFGNDGDLLRYDLPSNTFVIAPEDAGEIFNAGGIRVLDGFAYAVFFPSNELARISADGSVENLGPIVGLTATNLPAGDFANDGLLYLYAGTTLEFVNRMYVVNVETVSVVREITLDGPTFTAGDIAYNPVDGLFYAGSGILAGTDVPPVNLVAINVQEETAEVVGSMNLADDNQFASMFTDSTGRVFGVESQLEGNFYEFNTQTGNATLVGQTLASPAGQGPMDGLHCSIIRNVPTLSEWGLIAMAGILGIVGFIVIRRKQATA